MKIVLVTGGLVLLSLTSFSQQKSTQKKQLLHGVYLQWGYNTEWYTRSNIHFRSVVNGVDHNFKVMKARAHDRNDMDAIFKTPLEISVPQYNYRVGVYLNAKHTRAIEINYDHSKYIVYDNQRLRAKGYIGNNHFDKDTSFTGSEMHFEHTNGANFYHLNYVQQHVLKTNGKRPVFTAVWKAGGGVLIPKTDVTLSGKRVDNRFHVAGYCFSAEGGARWYPFSHLFVEGTGKLGFAHYTNSLAAGNGRVSHAFGYFELIGTVGYDIHF